MSSNEVNSSFSITTTYNTPEDNLTEREREILKRTDQLANRANDNKVIDFFNLSLREILVNWSNNMQAILIDITEEINIDNIIKNSTNVVDFFKTLFFQLWNIFTKEFRIIYFGITLIFISIFIYFTTITS
jgi:hypothetical protein